MFYNIARRGDLKPVIWLSGILATGYALNHVATAMLFDGKSFSEHVTFQYVLWSVACIAIIATIVLAKIVTNTRLYWVSKCAIILLCIDLFGNGLMHIDQNVIGLNSFAEPNNNWSTDHWMLWSWYSIQSNFNNALMLVVLFLPVGIEGSLMRQANNVRKVFKSLLNGFNFFRFIGGLNAAHNRVGVIQDMIDAMPLEQQHQAQSLLNSAKELLYRQDETGVDHLEGVNLLLDGAAHVALHAPAKQGSQHLAVLTTKGR